MKPNLLRLTILGDPNKIHAAKSKRSILTRLSNLLKSVMKVWQKAATNLTKTKIWSKCCLKEILDLCPLPQQPRKYLRQRLPLELMGSPSWD